MRWMRRAGRGCGRMVKSLVWDSKTGTISSGRVNLFITLSIASFIVYWLLSRIDRYFALKGDLPAGSLEVVAGIATVLFGGGVGGYMMNRFATRSYDSVILPEQETGSAKTDNPENF
jgi:hypothetical protein